MKHWSLVLLFFLCWTELMAQEDPIISKQTIRSQVLNDNRELLIYSPDGMHPKLPLIIVFDGGGLFSATVSAVRFMNNYSEIPQMPEALVVGVENTDRNRDMPIPQQYGGEKGEDNFMKFIKDELLPWANKKYSLNGHVILIGHSQGAYFASYLLSKQHTSFPWVIALDAPMNVSEKGTAVKQAISRSAADAASKIRYASIETAYGWGNEWTKYFPSNEGTMTKKLTNESHESMAYPGSYEGLKFLFKDFAPVRKDMNLAELREHYHSTSKQYGYNYEIPLRVLTASASRKIPENRKTEVMELLDHAESMYGANNIIASLKTRAASLSNTTYSVVDSFLALKQPTAEQIRNYIGSWKGQMTSKEGRKFPFAMEISMINDETKLLATFDPGNPDKKIPADVFHINKEGDIIFGIRNRGGGIIINILHPRGNTELSGEGWWKGFTIPDDVPADAKKQLNFLINTPTKFNLSRL